MSALTNVEPIEAVLMRPHGLLEGPCFGSGGEAVYSDVIAGGVWGCSREGEIREILPRRRGIGGIVPHADGGWVISGRSVIHVQPDGAQRELLSGEGVCGFNDLGSTSAGALLAGVLRYRPLAGEDPQPGQLLELGPGGELEDPHRGGHVAERHRPLARRAHDLHQRLRGRCRARTARGRRCARAVPLAARLG